MIAGSGVDICEVPRIRAAFERFGERFLKRVFTEGEIRYADRKANRFERHAARFAAKEAGMKAIGTGWRRGVRWRDFEVINLPTGKPTMVSHGKAKDFVEGLGNDKRGAIDDAHGGVLGTGGASLNRLYRRPSDPVIPHLPLRPRTIRQN